ncbi:30S ribosomal protein S17 [Candidatus Micrarchaeota archaeon]|nr:30S ribosomal protein S17 [Candidatus Micrarchaeota archaeon]
MVQCDDKNCYVHGDLKVRGAKVEGKVVSDKGKKTVIVERNISRIMPKYNRIAKNVSRLAAHNPSCINAKLGDTVIVAETKKISKTKAWTVVEILGKKAE